MFAPRHYCVLWAIPLFYLLGAVLTPNGKSYCLSRVAADERHDPLIGLWQGDATLVNNGKEATRKLSVRLGIEGRAIVTIDGIVHYGTFGYDLEGRVGETEIIKIKLREPRDELDLKLTKFEGNALDATGTLWSDPPPAKTFVAHLARQDADAVNVELLTTEFWRSSNPEAVLARYGLQYPLRPSALNQIDRMLAMEFINDVMESAERLPDHPLHFSHAELKSDEVKVTFAGLREDGVLPPNGSSDASKTDTLLLGNPAMIARLAEIRQRFFAPSVKITADMLVYQGPGFIRSADSFDAIKPAFIYKGRIDGSGMQAACVDAIEHMPRSFRVDRNSLQSERWGWSIKTLTHVDDRSDPNYLVWDQLRLTLDSGGNKFHMDAAATIWKQRRSDGYTVRLDNYTHWCGAVTSIMGESKTLWHERTNTPPFIDAQCIDAVRAKIKK